jgi:hypothetical protein
VHGSGLEAVPLLERRREHRVVDDLEHRADVEDDGPDHGAVTG